MKKDDIYAEGVITLFVVCIVLLFLTALLGGVIAYTLVKNRSYGLRSNEKIKVLLVSLVLITIFTSTYFILFFFFKNIYSMLIFNVVPVNVLIPFLALEVVIFTLSFFVFLLVFQKRKLSEKITLIDIYKKRIKDFTNYKKALYSPTLPIGVDVRNGQPVFISNSKRTHQMIVVGATGGGKTTLMKTMIKHAIINNIPSVVIDPKGDMDTIKELNEFSKTLGKENTIEVFSLSNIKESFYYNPIKYGDSSSRKDRLMASLNWSESYYNNLAAKYLSVIFPILEIINETPTLDKINMCLVDPTLQQRIRSALVEKLNAGKIAARTLEQFQEVVSISKKELSGLEAQLNILNNPRFGHLLSPTPNEKREIDFYHTLKEHKIAYFQLNTLGYGDSARRLGRMILEDIKSLSNDIYTGKVKRPEFFGVYVDEFGAFASTEFIEFLKQARGANFGLHLFCQGLEDLDAVSTEFRRQCISNPLTKIIFRQDDTKSVEELAGLVGTEPAIEQSHQVKRGLFGTYHTGLGNERTTRQMRIEHDVFKRLTVGKCILIEKSPSRERVIETWSGGG